MVHTVGGVLYVAADAALSRKTRISERERGEGVMTTPFWLHYVPGTFCGGCATSSAVPAARYSGWIKLMACCSMNVSLSNSARRITESSCGSILAPSKGKNVDAPAKHTCLYLVVRL